MGDARDRVLAYLRCLEVFSGKSSTVDSDHIHGFGMVGGEVSLRASDIREALSKKDETLRTILSLLDSNASRDNIRRVVEDAIEGGE